MSAPQTSVAESNSPIKGMLSDASTADVRSYLNSESSAEIPIGTMVGQGTAVKSALLLAAITDDLIGIVVHSHAYQKTNELGTTGLKPGVVMNVLRKGRCWVYAEEAVTPASPVLCRAIGTNGTPGDQPGDFRDTTDASDLIDVSAFCKYLSSTSAAGLVEIEVDMTNRDA